MKTKTHLAALVFLCLSCLFSCTKESMTRIVKKSKPIKITMSTSSQSSDYYIESERLTAGGDYWSSTVSMNAPEKADDGEYYLADFDGDSTYASMTLRMHRSARVADSIGNGFHGDGTWKLISTTGKYSKFTESIGTMTYTETAPYNKADAEDFHEVMEYLLIGLSN